MQPCLSEYTVIMAPKDKFLEAAAKAGFPAVEIAWSTIVAKVKNNEIPELARQLRANDLEVSSINGPDATDPASEAGFAKTLAEVKDVAAAARTIGCDLLMPGAYPVKGGLADQIVMDKTVESMQRLVDAAGEGLRFGYEFVGYNTFNVKDLQTARELVSRIGMKNFGITVDVFHMYLRNVPFSEIAKMRKDELFLVHVNDCRAGPVEKMTDADRVYPGLGAMDLKELKSSLDKLGYDGYLCLELFNRDYWKEDPAKVAQDGRSSIKETFGV